VVHGLPIACCRGCGLVFLGTDPVPHDFSDFYGRHAVECDAHPAEDAETGRDAARRYLRLLEKRGVTRGRILLLARDESLFLAEASARGFEVDVQTFSPAAGLRLTGHYDAAVLLHQLQTAVDPDCCLRQIHATVARGTPLVVTVPSIKSWPARFFGRQWIEWQPNNRCYFNPATIQLLLLRCGFRNILIHSDRRLYTIEHAYRRTRECPRTMLTRLISTVYRASPRLLRHLRVRLAASGMIAVAVRGELPEKRRCSIIVPAFNERKSFPILMDALLDKKIEGVEKEVIVVESNSSDGTRELAKGYAAQPHVRVLLQDRPRGKGNAVRQGLQHAQGDIVLIQDADLEYDLNDYESLLSPLLSYRQLFVLGNRHGANYKMRKFTDQQALALVLNFGHLFFTTLINVLYRQRLQDPFTMFKVFHRDCLYGLDFACDRFDFDHELLIKLMRKGYTPLEIPVNYASRSFRQGKKVRIFRDPLTWLWIDCKLRLSRLYRENPG
jgi:hypothetical protein